MRTIYPKLITTLFLILLAAIIVRFADSKNSADDEVPKTIHLSNR